MMEQKSQYEMLEEYLEQNPNELTNRQKSKLRKDFAAYDKDDGSASDELVDFILWLEENYSRTEQFAEYLNRALMPYSGGTILDVGCGPRALLARALIDRGFNVEAIDPKLELRRTRLFRRDTFTLDYKNLESYSAIVALEPCEATEVIIRACSKTNVPFFVVPCGTPHPRMDGTVDKSVYAWWSYLRRIGADINLSTLRLNDSFVLPILSYLA